jgi:hypothetical protein
MDRRAFISGITLGLLAAPLAAEGQQAGKIARIGLLRTGLLRIRLSTHSRKDFVSLATSRDRT